MIHPIEKDASKDKHHLNIKRRNEGKAYSYFGGIFIKIARQTTGAKDNYFDKTFNILFLNMQFQIYIYIFHPKFRKIQKQNK